MRIRSEAKRGIFSGLAFILGIAVLSAGDKSGVEPTVVSLPSGPGSIEGLGESFEPMLQTGTAKYRLDLALPPGAAGQGPSLALSYDGGFGNGPLGYGWECGVSAVKRQCERGVPRYRDGGDLLEEDTFLGTDGIEPPGLGGPRGSPRAVSLGGAGAERHAPRVRAHGVWAYRSSGIGEPHRQGLDSKLASGKIHRRPRQRDHLPLQRSGEARGSPELSG
jgi:hypothetical protein